MTNSVSQIGATMTLSTEQQSAIEFVITELMEPRSKSGMKYVGGFGPTVVALSGPAGSGKTTTIKQLVEQLSERSPVIVSAMTNKASLVLQQKGIDALTVHQACMKPLFKEPLNSLAQYLEKAANDDGFSEPAGPPPAVITKQYSEAQIESAVYATEKFGICAALRGLGIRDMFKYLERWLPKERQDGVLIVDEASMLSATDFGTIKSVFGKILLVGDEYQLPPVDPQNKDSEGVFWTVERRFALTEIHRQCADSQPLRIATAIRSGGEIEVDEIVPIDIERAKAGTPCIVWRNATRIRIVNYIREQIGYGGLGPQPGEYLVCRNGSDKAAKNRGLVNNTIWKVLKSDGMICTLESDGGFVLHDEYVHMEELEEGLGVPFRFAYALTAHNAQGSEWPEVMIHFADGKAFFKMNRDDAKKWLYTAVTRAKERAIFIEEPKRRLS